MLLLLGPCVIESEAYCLGMARKIKAVCDGLGGVPVISDIHEAWQTEAEIIAAINATNAGFNTLLAKLRTHGILDT